MEGYEYIPWIKEDEREGEESALDVANGPAVAALLEEVVDVKWR